MSKRKLVYLYLILAIVLMVSNVMVIVLSSTKGVELMALEAELSELTRENRELSTNLVTSSSLSMIGETAVKNELATPEQIIYLNGNELMASINGN